MRSLLLVPLILSLPLASTSAAAVNCGAATSPREKTLCTSPELASLDDRVSRALAAAEAELSPASASLMQSDQREWSLWLDKVCPANNPATDIKPCLQNNYANRLDQLTGGIQRINGTLFFTRAHFVFKPGKPPAKDEKDNDPGFGYGQFAWPQADAPDPDHALFNTAAYKAAVDIEAVNLNSKAATLDTAVDNTGYLYGSFTLYAANDRLIDVDFSNSGYSWGGAHPLTTQSSFLWRLDLRHALTAADILRSDTAWKEKLVDPTIAKLQASNSPDSIWKGEELRTAVVEGIKNATAWDLSSKGLTITFGQYAVAPYAAGMPTTAFTWKELTPYLNPTFDPQILPSSIQ